MAKVNISNIDISKFDATKISELNSTLSQLLGAEVAIELPKNKLFGNFNMKENSETEATCRYCNSEFDITSHTEETLNEAKKRGLCPTCMAKLIEADKIRAATSFRSSIKSANPPAQVVRSILTNNDIPDSLLSGLLDKDFTTKNTGISYPMLKEAHNNDTSDARRIGKYLRYSPKTIDINGSKYYLINEIIERNMARINTMFSKFGINPASNTVDINLSASETDEASESNEEVIA